MNPLNIDGWRQLANEDPEQWKHAIGENLDLCIEKTGTSVTSCRMDAFADATIGALTGVPCAVKDLFNVRGYLTHNSSVLPQLLKEPVADDSELVLRLRKLGAFCAAKTQMNEFAYGLSGENPHYGDCPHPTLENCLSGGSSSGSAHLVGAGYLPLAFGTDTGGSIRIPAAWCGIYGIRWTPGYQMEGAFPLAPSFDTMGWFTRSSEDMSFILRAWFDIQKVEQGVTLKGCSILPKDLVEPEVYKKLKSVVERLKLPTLKDAGAFEQQLPSCQLAFNVLQSREALSIHEAWIAEYGAFYDPQVKARIERAESWTEVAITNAEESRMRVTEWFEQYFETHDFLVMPICPGPSVPPSESKPELREQTLKLTTPASLAGLPVLSVPVWLDSNRSVGLQFIFKEVAPRVPLAILELCKNI
ncbi:MAG: amidase [Opitutaceae bacterium]